MELTLNDGEVFDILTGTQEYLIEKLYDILERVQSGNNVDIRQA